MRLLSALLSLCIIQRVRAFSSQSSSVRRSSSAAATLASSRFTNTRSPHTSRLATVPNSRTGAFRMLFGGLNAAMRSKGPNYDELKGCAAEAAAAAKQGKVLTKSEAGYDVATFAGGCFWGPELLFQRVPGVTGTAVGYTQGQNETPSYEEVCSGSTGHTEATLVFYDPKECSYRTLLDTFFNQIDATQVNGQGGDRGTQYRTGVYTHSDAQAQEAKVKFEELKSQTSRPIATELLPAKVFWPAEAYHQQYLSAGGRFGSVQSAEKGCTDKIRCYG